MLPPDVSDLLQFELEGAADLAKRGDVRRGYELLILALARSESARDAGEPWGEALMEQYRQGIADYESRYGSPTA